MIERVACIASVRHTNPKRQRGRPAQPARPGLSHTVAFALIEWRAAKDSLEKSGAHVTLADYDGGHGWHGDVFGSIRQGIDWLAEQSKPEAPGAKY